MNALDYFNTRLEATISPMDYLRCAEANPEEYFLMDVRNGPEHVETLGFVERTKNPNDRRSYSLLITPKGNQVLDSRWEFLIETELEVLEPLSKQEKELLKEFLVKIWNTL
ncbi:MarR family winged helix-turn-helix transcriptional regulator [Cytobacillus gottheilii]|uniref:MarR family winged helix-turn-helix transcriptional regulator n=1 Tax=Cytobacillus gottheilii TaxID=859144 RepID=UPI001FE8DCAE|nr:rhodanese-like domain-containing protein [Cytobacillus gottheilii]